MEEKEEKKGRAYLQDEGSLSSQCKGAKVSLPTSTRFPIQKPKTKKNSVFQFLLDEARDFIRLQFVPLAVN